MSKNIKGITVQIGADTKGLDKALKDVNKESKDIQKELREVDKLLRFNPGNTELLAQKQKLLGDQVETTGNKLSKLKDAEKEVQEQFKKGEISEEQYRAFQREIVETESKLNHYEGQLKSTAKENNIFAKSMSDASVKMKSMGDKLSDTGASMTKKITAPAIAAGGAMFGFASKTAEAGDVIHKHSQQLGVSSEAYQELEYWAGQNGIAQGQMEKAVGRLNQRIGMAREGNEKYSNVMQQLGVDMGRLKDGTLSTEDAFEQSVAGLMEMTNEQDKAAVATELFGVKLARDLLPALNDGSLSIEEAKQKAREMNIIMSDDAVNASADFSDNMDDLKRSLGGVARRIGESVLPILNDSLIPTLQEKVIPAIGNVIDKIADIINWYGELNPATQTIIKTTLGVAIVAGPVLVALGKLIGSIALITKTIGLAIGAIMGITAPIAIAIGAIVAMIAIGVALYKNWDAIKEKASQLGSFISGKFKQIGEWMSKPVESAKNKISNTVDNIKGFFSNMKLSIPKIKMPKMPKFKLTGGFSLRPPSVPKISWHAKGGIFKQPTLLGDGSHGVGEKGAEAVLPLSQLSGILADTLRSMGIAGNQNENSNTAPSQKQDVNYNIEINNPVAEKSSESVRKTLLKASYGL